MWAKLHFAHCYQQQSHGFRATTTQQQQSKSGFVYVWIDKISMYLGTSYYQFISLCFVDVKNASGRVHFRKLPITSKKTWKLESKDN